MSQDFAQQQQLLAEGFQALLQRGATPAQIQAWQDANADLFQEQQQRAVLLGAYSAAQPLPYVEAVTIPADATQVLANLLVTQANLFNAFAALHNQALADPNASEGSVQAAFQAQNAADLQVQVQQAQALATQPATQPLPVPPPLTIPPGASPVLAAFLAVRDQIARQQAALWNQFLGQPVAARDAAIQQWQQQNQAFFQQLQQLAQRLAQPSGH